MYMDDLLTFYVIFVILSTVTYLYETINDDNTALTYCGFISRYLYEKTEMNIFGCILIALLYYIVIPILIIKSLAVFVIWLFHVGRKE